MGQFRQFLEKNDLKQKIQYAADLLRGIVNPLSRKMMSRDIPKAHDASLQYWQNPSFIQWLRQQGVQRVPHTTPRYRDGGAGRAYFIDDFVVKFTGNPIEAYIAKKVAGRTDLPAPIIAVKELGSGLFAILEHKVQMGDEIDKRILDAADWVTLVIDENPNLVPNNEREQELLIRRTLEEENGPLELLPYMKMVVVALSVLYHATGFKHDDAGPTNIGLHKDKIVFPDLGPNQTRDFSVDQAMDQITQNRKSLGLV